MAIQYSNNDYTQISLSTYLECGHLLQLTRRVCNSPDFDKRVYSYMQPRRYSKLVVD